MPRGGYRPNSGPKKGTKYKPRAKKPDSKPKTRATKKSPAPKKPSNLDVIKKTLEQGINAKAKLYQELIKRIASGDELTPAEKRLFTALDRDLSSTVKNDSHAETEIDIKKDAKAANLDPLEYMLKIMNDENAEKDRRDRMATIAAPYIHPKADGTIGKKDEKKQRARAASGGKFASAAPPQLKAVK